MCTHVFLLPLLLEGQPATQNGCADVGVWELFQGHQLVPAGPPTLKTPLWSTEPPFQLSTTLGSCPGCSLKLLLPCVTDAATAEGECGKTLGTVVSLTFVGFWLAKTHSPSCWWQWSVFTWGSTTAYFQSFVLLDPQVVYHLGWACGYVGM